MSLRSKGGDLTGLRNASFWATVVLTIAVVTLLFNHGLFAGRSVFLAPQVLAALLMLWARFTLRGRSFHVTSEPTAGELVTTGPYHFIRHPIYSAILIFVFAGVAAHPSLLNGGLAAIAAGGLVVRMLTEEKSLAGCYPEYAAYAAITKRVVPYII